MSGHHLIITTLQNKTILKKIVEKLADESLSTSDDVMFLWRLRQNLMFQIRWEYFSWLQGDSNSDFGDHLTHHHGSNEVLQFE